MMVNMKGTAEYLALCWVKEKVFGFAGMVVFLNRIRLTALLSIFEDLNVWLSL